MASPESVPVETKSFKEKYLDLQHIAREVLILHRRNQSLGPFAVQDGFLFAQGTLTLLALERFLRAILQDASDGDKFRSLLTRAFDSGLLEPPFEDRTIAIQRICDFRNALAHGNFGQAARAAGARSVREYLDTRFAAEARHMLEVVDKLMAQIDPATGLRRT